MSAAEAANAAIDHLESMSTLQPDLSEQYQNLVNLYQKKLWHQLTMSTLEFVSVPSATLRTTAEGINSYHALFEKKINQLNLARIASFVAFSLLDDPPYKDGKRDRLGPAAALYAEARLGLLGLTVLARSGEALTTESSVRRWSPQRKQLPRTAMTYRKAVGPPEAYYREAIQYVAYTNLSELSQEERYNIATDLSLAALTGEVCSTLGKLLLRQHYSVLRELNYLTLGNCYRRCKGRRSRFPTCGG
ncbi:26S proteasome regulatory subunit RPN9 [Skeletonema marinoi]|uniref:26S proteasome regulatory subunit RPN9 n=1 Tax=Skeletonema marinoi TaxID=267567 RepID=A0AAD8YEA3_9STRA|nr:26S proteasome regulatory subunit RPN9 [Skeletonema marinoi]